MSFDVQVYCSAYNLDLLCYSLRDNKITEELEDLSSGNNSKDTTKYE